MDVNIILDVLSWLSVSIFPLTFAWAAGILIRESIMKKKLAPLESDAIGGLRRQKGRSEVSDEKELEEVRMRIAAIYEVMNGDGGFNHRSDLMFAYRQIMACRALLPSENDLIGKINEVSDLIKSDLRRCYMLLAVGGKSKFWFYTLAVLSTLALFTVSLAPLAIPFLVYLLFGRTPMCVARNPSKFDAFFSGAAVGALLGGFITLPAIFNATEYKLVERGTGRVVGHGADINIGQVIAVFITLFLLILSLLMFVIRIWIMFVRNYMIYR